MHRNQPLTSVCLCLFFFSLALFLSRSTESCLSHQGAPDSISGMFFFFFLVRSFLSATTKDDEEVPKWEVSLFFLFLLSKQDPFYLLRAGNCSLSELRTELLSLFFFLAPIIRILPPIFFACLGKRKGKLNGGTP